MPISPQATKLKEALIHFEAQLETEVDTDDQKQVHLWTQAVRQAFDELDAIVDARRQRIHAKLFSEIGDHDESEQSHIRALQEADTQVDNLLEIVKSQLIVLSIESSSEVEARVENQATENEPLQEVIDRGTELIHWIRDQEESVTSWFAEAFANGA